MNTVTKLVALTGVTVALAGCTVNIGTPVPVPSVPAPQYTVASQPTAVPQTTTAPATKRTSTPTQTPSPEVLQKQNADLNSGPANPDIQSGAWVLVLESVPHSDGIAKAWRLNEPYGGYVIDSDDYSGLNPGYWAVVLGPYSSKSTATGDCIHIGRDVGGACYPRKL